MTFDRAVIVAGVVISLLVAVVPVIVAVINRGKKDNPSPPQSSIDSENEITEDYVNYLKGQISRYQDNEVAMLEKNQALHIRITLLTALLITNGVPVPPE